MERCALKWHIMFALLGTCPHPFSFGYTRITCESIVSVHRLVLSIHRTCKSIVSVHSLVLSIHRTYRSMVLSIHRRHRSVVLLVHRTTLYKPGKTTDSGLHGWLAGGLLVIA